MVVTAGEGGAPDISGVEARDAPKRPLVCRTAPTTSNHQGGTSLMAQGLRLPAPSAGGLSSISGQGIGSHMLQLKDPKCHDKGQRSRMPQLGLGIFKNKYF